MSQETAQPFSKDQPRHADDSALVEQVLGSKEATEMRELAGDQVLPREESGDMQLALTDDEQIATAETGVTKEERRREFIVWAESTGLERGWIDRDFVFNADGSVEVSDNLIINVNELLIELPPGLVKVDGFVELTFCNLKSLRNFPQEIDGDVLINNNQLTSLEGLPEEIDGDLDIKFNPITSLEHLAKKINGNVFLDNIKATSIPRGLEINGTIFLSSEQEELAKDAVSKGYSISKLHSKS